MPLLTVNQAKGLLFQHLEANMPTGFVISNTKYPNAPGQNEANVPYLEPSVEFFRSQIVSAGKPYLRRTPGAFSVRIRIPKGDGDQLAGQAQDHLLSLFANNNDFRRLGFKFQGDEVLPEETLLNDGHYTETINIFFYIEGR